jgi:hypothetical protein
VDIFAKEEETGNRIIIENQLEATNHDHLGKIITYASGKDAKIIVWIVKKARDEHKQAIEWLNQHTDSDLGFFLVEIELYKIGDSMLAPKFNVVERPNDWAKQEKAREGLSDSDNLRLSFWQAFNDYSENNAEFKKFFKTRKPLPQGWYDLSLGSTAAYISMAMRTANHVVQASLYFPDMTNLYPDFKLHKSEVDNDTNNQLEWHEAKKAAYVFFEKKIDVTNPEEWQKAFQWLNERILELRAINLKYNA